jgi:hypothetical protein
MDILVRHGNDWCQEADKMGEGAIVISEDPQKRMGPETWSVFEIRHEEHESIHHIGLVPNVNLALVYAKSFRVERVRGFKLSSFDRQCRVCGCTQERACIKDGQACHWISTNLCSACI